MIQYLSLRNSRATLAFSALAALAVSCGSYQQASYYDNDGIYGGSNDRVNVERVQTRPTQNKRQKEEDRYAAYFSQKAQQYDEILDGEIFTDIDSYTSNGANDSISGAPLTDYYNSPNDYSGNGAWGDNPSSVTVNIYDNGWNNWGGGGFWGWNDPWLWNNWGWNNWGWGGYGWGWNRWNNWGWGGYGWGWNNWGWGGYAWCPPYGYNSFYGNRNFAYSPSRRGYYARNDFANNSGRVALATRTNLNTSRGDMARYRTTASRSSSDRNGLLSARSSNNYRTGSTTRRTVGVDQNQAYRTSRSTRATPNYNYSSRSSQANGGASRDYSGYQNGTRSSSTFGNRANTPSTSTYRSSGSRTQSSGNYGSSGANSGGSYRSSGSNSGGSYRSSGSNSGGSYRSSSPSSSSGGSYRSSGSSGGSSRSSGTSGGGASRSSGGGSRGRQ